MSSFALDNLRSRKIRKSIETRRNVDSIGRAIKRGSGGVSGIFANVVNGLLRASGWIGTKLIRTAGFLWNTAVGFLDLSFSAIWDVCFEAFISFKEFDWNATDAALEKQITRNNQRIVTAAAQTLGETLPYGVFTIANLAVGRYVGLLKGIKIPVLSARIGLALAEEGADELRSSLRSFFGRSTRAMASNAFISTVLTFRRNQWLGARSVTESGIDGSISARIDRKIEKLPEFWQEPVEEFLESFEDGMHDAGYVVAFTIDDHMAAHKAAKQQEQERVIEVVPEKGAQPLVFAGPQDEVQQAITTTLATYERFENAGIAIPKIWELQPGFDRSQLAITFRGPDKRTSGVLHIPHYDGTKNPQIPSYTTGPWQTKWILKDGSTLLVYTDTKQLGKGLVRNLARYIPSFYKTGEPSSICLDRKIKVKKVEPRTADYYPKGPAPIPEWRHYFPVL